MQTKAVIKLWREKDLKYNILNIQIRLLFCFEADAKVSKDCNFVFTTYTLI